MKMTPLVLALSFCVPNSAFAQSWSPQPESVSGAKASRNALNIGVKSSSDKASAFLGGLPKTGTSTFFDDLERVLLGQALISPPENTSMITVQWISPEVGTESLVGSALPNECKNNSDQLTRAGQWDWAYKCLKAHASNENSFIQTTGGDLYIVEPVLDLVDLKFKSRVETFLESPEKEAQNPRLIVDTLQIVAASKVWPSREIGWHKNPDYSQLNAAYEQVFPQKLAQKGQVRIAHLDTGYWSKDKMLPMYLDIESSATCTEEQCLSNGGARNEEIEADNKGLSPWHGTHTLSNLAGGLYLEKYMMGANPSAQVFSVRIHNSFIHIDSRTMARGIEYAVDRKADVISLSHGGLPSARLAAAINTAYDNGTPIFAATGDFMELPLWLGRTFSEVVYPARYSRVMGVAGATAGKKEGQISYRSYGDDPSLSLRWIFDFGNGYLSRIGSWMLRGNFGPTNVMAENVISAFAPNISHSDATPPNDYVIAHNGAGTSHATPQVSGAASIWLEKNINTFSAEKWRSWEKSEAVYQALQKSANACFADYNVEHFGRGVLHANDALSWSYEEVSNTLAGPSGTKNLLTQRKMADLDLPGVIRLARSIKLPSDFPETLRVAFVRAIITEFSQLVFTSPKLQKILQKGHICEPRKEEGCFVCTKQDFDWSKINLNELIEEIKNSVDASSTFKTTLRDTLSGDNQSLLDR